VFASLCIPFCQYKVHFMSADLFCQPKPHMRQQNQIVSTCALPRLTLHLTSICLRSFRTPFKSTLLIPLFRIAASYVPHIPVLPHQINSAIHTVIFRSQLEARPPAAGRPKMLKKVKIYGQADREKIADAMDGWHSPEMRGCCKLGGFESHASRRRCRCAAGSKGCLR
jgi:hypothetical protein